MNRDILTTVVGSYPAPEWLMAHRTEEGLRDAMMVVMKRQEMTGIDLIADGELNRYDFDHPETSGMIDYFVRPLQNIRAAVSRAEDKKFEELTHLRFRTQAAGVVEGQIGEGSLNLARDFQRARELTARPLKFTVTSPYMLARTLLDKHYKSREDLVIALSDVLAGQLRDVEAEVVQVDEENLTGNPSDGPWVAEALNRIFAVIPRKSALHLCFGNYAGQVVQQGNYRQLIDFINLLNVDHVLLELARRGPDELAAIREIRPEIGIGLGVIDVKSTVIETADQVAGAIEHAEKILGPGRLKYVHPDCGFWMHKRTVADAKMAALVRGRDLFLGDNARR
jgi:5-methyltetrahydropteroyltriglutamate--homocysteine methyltransferase